MINELETDEFGCVNNIRYHDGYLLGVQFRDPYYKRMIVNIMSIDEVAANLVFEEVIASNLTDFKNGSVIFDIYKWQSHESYAKETLRKLGYIDDSNNISEVAKNKICVKIECVNDCELILICNSVQYLGA